MLSELINTSGWTHEQWLAAAILSFAVISVLVVIHRIFKLFQMSKKPSYQPNLRPLRRKRLRATEKPSENDK
jgi:hypothetical protein